LRRKFPERATRDCTDGANASGFDDVVDTDVEEPPCEFVT